MHCRHAGWAVQPARFGTVAAILARFHRGTSVATVGVTMNTMPAPTTTSTAAATLPRPLGYHGAVSDFKRRLIEATLHQMRGNRTHAARVLGLQRTYLLRLMRELGVAVPPPPPRRAGHPG